VNSILVAFAVTIAVTLGLGFGYTPTVAFAMVGTGIVIAGCHLHSYKRGVHRLLRPGTAAASNVLSHLIIPLLGIAAFVPAWLTAAGIKAFSFVAPLTPPYSYMGPGRGRAEGHRSHLPDLPVQPPSAAGRRGGLVHLDAEVQPASGRRAIPRQVAGPVGILLVVCQKRASVSVEAPRRNAASVDGLSSMRQSWW
jgi:hypothetical protein